MKLSENRALFLGKISRTQIKESPKSLFDLGQDSVLKHEIKERWSPYSIALESRSKRL